jgi:transposase
VTHPLRAAIERAEQELARLSAERDALLTDCVVWEGMTYREASAVFGVSHQRVGQIVARYRARNAHVKAMTPAEEVGRARDAAYVAQYAQDLRCEALTGNGREEVRSFYGDEDAPTMTDAERRITASLGAWHEGQARARTRYEEAG